MKTFIFSFCLIFTTDLFAQKIFYSLTDRNNARNIEYSIIGKLEEKYFVNKNIRNERSIVIYNKDMEPGQEVFLDFIPQKAISVQTFRTGNGIFILYQYHKRNVAYCILAKLDT